MSQMILSMQSEAIAFNNLEKPILKIHGIMFSEVN